MSRESDLEETCNKVISTCPFCNEPTTLVNRCIHARFVNIVTEEITYFSDDILAQPELLREALDTCKRSI